MTEDLLAKRELLPLASVWGETMLIPPAPLIEAGSFKLFALASLLSAKLAILAKALSTEMPYRAEVSK